MFEEFLLRYLSPETASVVIAIVMAIAAYIGARQDSTRRAKIILETKIRKILRKQLDLPVPSSREYGKDQLLADIAEINGSGVNLTTWDGTYYAPSPKDSTEFYIVGRILDLLPFRPERFDCENYALFYKTICALFYGVNTVGIVTDWSGEHAYNVVVYADGSYEFIEPQSGNVVKTGEGKYAYEDVDLQF